MLLPVGDGWCGWCSLAFIEVVMGYGLAGFDFKE